MRAVEEFVAKRLTTISSLLYPIQWYVNQDTSKKVNCGLFYGQQLITNIRTSYTKTIRGIIIIHSHES